MKQSCAFMNFHYEAIEDEDFIITTNNQNNAPFLNDSLIFTTLLPYQEFNTEQEQTNEKTNTPNKKRKIQPETEIDSDNDQFTNDNIHNNVKENNTTMTRKEKQKDTKKKSSQ